MSSLLRHTLLRSESHFSPEAAAQLTFELDDDADEQHDEEAAATAPASPVPPVSDHAGLLGLTFVDLASSLPSSDFTTVVFAHHLQCMHHLVMHAAWPRKKPTSLAWIGKLLIDISLCADRLTEPLTQKERKTGTTWQVRRNFWSRTDTHTAACIVCFSSAWTCIAIKSGRCLDLVLGSCPC